MKKPMIIFYQKGKEKDPDFPAKLGEGRKGYEQLNKMETDFPIAAAKILGLGRGRHFQRFPGNDAVGKGKMGSQS